MILLKNMMENSNLFSVDEFGVKNYNYTILAIISFTLFSALNIILGYITFVAEASTIDSPVQNYADAFWLMLMSSTTIGFGDVYPITLTGRIAVFIMFILGVGILGSVGAIFANKIFGFADTNIKNRELRHQNAEIIIQNHEIHKKLAALECKLAMLNETLDDSKVVK